MTAPTEMPLEVDVQTVHTLRSTQAPLLLLDCREVSEWNRVHIAGATLIPMREIPQRLAELEAHRHERIVVQCHHGGRSFQVATWLRTQGFEKAQSLAGGIDAWSQEIDPNLPRY